MPSATCKDGRAVRVWDLPTRLFHLGVVAMVAACWWTYASERMAWHRLCGYGVVGLLTFRLYWGFAGSSTARFGGFVRGPREAWLYIRGRAGVVVGHNPLGGWSVLALLGVLSTQVVSGLFTTDRADLAPGPFASALGPDAARLAERVHALAFRALLVMVALHVAVVLLHLAFGDDLVSPMLHGRKRLPSAGVAPQVAPWWMSIPGGAAALVVVFLLWRLDPS
ncbi:cytochrome b/b6 domain-containing protein [Phenylobacterium sp.]|uniref:cytochrome b/b6 domain-containing protein n=1 Tax=Phenylobacterium sp. TaxID=1871053 RepID=UPI0035652B15